MEQGTTPNGFSIVNSKIPIHLTLKQIRDLKPHEEIVETDLRGIIAALKRDPVLRHPIIADSSSGAVLDGTHRLEALKRLGCSTIPTALIEYQNPLVKIDRWFRVITGKNLEDFTLQVKQPPPLKVAPSEADAPLLERSYYATLRDRAVCYAVKSNDATPLKICQQAYRLEQTARDDTLKISYTDNNDIQGLPDSSFLMSTIRLQKSEVIASCEGSYLFPPKSTRHLIPSRPLGLGVRLELLKRTNVRESEVEFEQYLRSKRISRKPEGSWIGSRRYLEEVFLFE